MQTTKSRNYSPLELTKTTLAKIAKLSLCFFVALKRFAEDLPLVSSCVLKKAFSSFKAEEAKVLKAEEDRVV